MLLERQQAQLMSNTKQTGRLWIKLVRDSCMENVSLEILLYLGKLETSCAIDTESSTEPGIAAHNGI